MKVVAGEHLGIESRRNALSPAQRAILDVRLKGNGAIADVAVTKKRASGEFIPLIPNQHRLWLHQQLAVESASYHLGLGVRIRGEVRSELLELCLNRLIERHDAFRVTFRVVSGEPVQIVSAPFATSLPVVDLSSLADGEREETIEQEASNIRSQAFDLEVGPLFRARLFKCGSNEFVFLMVTHHIISDGWSQGIVMRDLAAMYSAETGRNELRLPKLEMQFSDYAWEYNERRHNELHNERAAAWWKDARSGAARLPFDKPQPGTARSRTIVRSRKLVPALLLGLGDLAKRNGTTVYVILLAAFGVFLRRYTGQTEFLILSPTANRDRAETVDIVGYLVDTLWLKVEVPADSTFADYVKDIHQAVIRAYEFRDTSPPLAVLGPSGDGEADIGGDVMQLGFFFDNSPTPGLNTAEFTIIRRAFAKAEAKFTLALVVQTNLAVPSIGFEFRRELFEPATVEGMLSNFWHLLEGIVCDADRRLSALPLLTTAERHRLAVEWNDTAAAYPSDKCLHELFAAQAARTPDAVAVTYEDRCLSYGELDRRSNQLAHYLRGLGVGPEIVVGLCVERSPEMVIGLLGILKAGGAYLPLDPSYPPERLGYMVADAAAPILVTQASLVEQLPRCDARLVSVDADWEEIARQRQELPASGACAENLAYVIYTSGSTGKPKGAMIRHCAVVNLLFTLRQRLGFTADDVVLAVTRFSFDMSVPEFYLPLLLGGSVALQSRQVAASGARLNDAIRNAGATVMQATPTSWSMLLDAGWRPTDGLRVWCGGEAFPAHLAAALNVAGAEIWNLYGPTETTVWSSASRLVPGCGVPLGRPLGNMRLYVLDDWLEVLPLGARGELYVGGIGLARGYLKRAALTAERFVPSPFGHGERLYRTGDLARWRADGELEFLGRADHQVKLRGYRIELGEIEAALRRHDGIQDAVVVTRGDDAGDKRLVGYVVRRSDAARPDAGALRAHVKQSLPDYMVPSAFVVIDALPLTPNGKIDRKALPAPASGEGIVQAAYEAARSPTEEVLAGIWCEVLKLDRVGVHDNFFELGGHSLLATRVTARLREAFAVELALRAVFEAPTLQGLAAHVEELRRQAAGTPLPPLQAQPRPQQLPLSFEQERIWFVDRLFPESVAQHLPLAVRVHGPFDVTALQRALEAIAQRHSVLRSRFPAIDGRPQQIVSQSTSIAVMRIDLTDIAPANRHEELHSRLIEQQRRRFDLERDPPIRICLFELGSSERVLSATIHHIAADGWSLGIFVRELEHLYRAFSRSEEPSLPELPIQYADFASWQRTTFHMEPIQAQLRYWTDTLRGALPSIALPTDRMRPARMTFTAAARSALVPKELAGGLVAVARGRKATLFMVLLAALKLVLFRWTGQKDLVVGTVMGNRHHVATEGLIGCFLNFLPLRSILSEADTFPAILQRCRNMILQAYANLDCPFEKIIEAVNPPRRLNQTPLYNVGLLLQNYPKQLTTADGGLSRISLPNRTAQLDLRLIATEIDNGILIECEYGTELFEAATIVNLLDFYVGVLDRVSNAPDIRLADVALPPALAAQVVMSGGRFGSAAADKADDSILELLAGIESLSDAEAEIGAATAKGLRDEHVG